MLRLARWSTLFWAAEAATPPDAVGFTSEGGRAVLLAGAWGQCGGAGEGSECSENGLLLHGIAPWWKLNNSIPEDTCSPLLEGARAEAV